MGIWIFDGGISVSSVPLGFFQKVSLPARDVSECCQSASFFKGKVLPKTTSRSLSLQITHTGYKSIVLLFASWHVLAIPCIQLKTQNSPLCPEPLKYPCISEETLEVDRTVFPSPNEVIVLEISPGSLFKETTGWGQRQFLLPGACSLASSF